MLVINKNRTKDSMPVELGDIVGMLRRGNDKSEYIDEFFCNENGDIVWATYKKPANKSYLMQLVAVNYYEVVKE